MNLPDFSFLTNYRPTSLTMIVTAMLIGIVIASTAMVYRQRFLGGIVRNIIQKNAFSEDSALTLEELGYNPKNFFIRFALRQNSTFTKTVHRTTDEQARYFIPQEIKDREEIRFRKKGNDLFAVFLGLIVFVAIGFISLTVIPWFKDALSNIFS